MLLEAIALSLSDQSHVNLSGRTYQVARIRSRLRQCRSLQLRASCSLGAEFMEDFDIWLNLESDSARNKSHSKVEYIRLVSSSQSCLPVSIKLSCRQHSRAASNHFLHLSELQIVVVVPPIPSHRLHIFHFTMKYSYAALVLSLAAIGHSSPILQRSKNCSTSVPICRDVFLPITAAANNTVLPAYPNSTEPGVAYKYLASFNASTLPTAPVSGVFNISATYCEPSVSVEGRNGTIQVLLHGLSYTKVSLNIP